MTEAFVTLATTNGYVCGALVWAYSLKEVKTTKQIACLLTQDISPQLQDICKSVFDHVEIVNVLDSQDVANLTLLSRPDLGVTFTKLHCWRLTQYQKAVFMDADTLVLQNIDDLFEREEFSAAPDPGWPDCFNSGVFVFQPSQQTYDQLLKFSMEHGSFDGGDQGLLNLFFSDWATKDIEKHLPFLYNVISHAFYSYPPALARFRSRIRVVHFIGPEKPWLTDVDQHGQVVTRDPANMGTPEFLRYWWHIFSSYVQPKLNSDMTPEEISCGLIGRLAGLELAVSCPQTIIHHMASDSDRQLAWERGQMDYMGSDSFERIQRILESKINEKGESS